MATWLELPVELIHLVVRFLCLDDLKSLRQCCRHTNAQTWAVFLRLSFQERYSFFDRTSIGTLRLIAKNELLRHAVHVVGICTEHLFQIEDKTSYEHDPFYEWPYGAQCMECEFGCDSDDQEDEDPEEASELADFVLRHQSTLEDLTLRDVTMHGADDWISLLCTIRDMPMVRRLHMENCQTSGFISKTEISSLSETICITSPQMIAEVIAQLKVAIPLLIAKQEECFWDSDLSL